jgi:hypothetical protein
MRILRGNLSHGLSSQAISDLGLMLYGHWDQDVNCCGLELNIVDYLLSLSVGDFVLVEVCVNVVAAHHIVWMWLSLFCDSLKISHLLCICRSIPNCFMYCTTHVQCSVRVVFMFRLRNGSVKAVNCY